MNKKFLELFLHIQSSRCLLSSTTSSSTEAKSTKNFQFHTIYIVFVRRDLPAPSASDDGRVKQKRIGKNQTYFPIFPLLKLDVSEEEKNLDIKINLLQLRISCRASARRKK